MDFRQLRIVFLGTPEFAVGSLEALVAAGCNIVGVVTAPDKPAGRGMKMSESAVKKFAVAKGLKVLQPSRLRDEAFLEELRGLKAHLQVVVAFRMLPEAVWSMPPMGTINVHGSLLPAYRGAAPINWAIINGEEETGVTTFKLKHEIDTGDILLQKKIIIEPSDDAGSLHDKMKVAGAELLVQTIEGLAGGELKEQQQNAMTAGKVWPHAPKIFTDTCSINWEQPVKDIHNLIRGLSPYPGAFTYLNDKKLKIYKAVPEQADHGKETGKVVSDGKQTLKFTAPDGYISITELQLEGKKRMETADFLRGYRVQNNEPI